MAEGNRLLSGYRAKNSVPGSNPGLSAARFARLPTPRAAQIRRVFVGDIGLLGRARPQLSLAGICGKILR